MPLAFNHFPNARVPPKTPIRSLTTERQRNTPSERDIHITQTRYLAHNHHHHHSACCPSARRFSWAFWRASSFALTELTRPRRGPPVVPCRRTPDVDPPVLLYFHHCPSRPVILWTGNRISLQECELNLFSGCGICGGWSVS